MATMADIVTGAAKRLRIIAADETLDANDSADILQALNDMFASWEAKGVNILFTADLALTATFPLTDKHIAGVKAMLAERVAEDFGKPVSAILARDALDGWSAVNADYRLPDDMQVDRALANLPSQRRVGTV